MHLEHMTWLENCMTKFGRDANFKGWLCFSSDGVLRPHSNYSGVQGKQVITQFLASFGASNQKFLPVPQNRSSSQARLIPMALEGDRVGVLGEFDTLKVDLGNQLRDQSSPWLH